MISLNIAEKSAGSRESLVLLRWALAVIFLWFGGMKFTSYEANGIAPFIAHSPIMSWLHVRFGVQGASDVLGVIELATAVALIVGAFNGFASALGAAMSCSTYIITLILLSHYPRRGRADGRRISRYHGANWTVPAQGSGAARNVPLLLLASVQTDEKEARQWIAPYNERQGNVEIP